MKLMISLLSFFAFRCLVYGQTDLSDSSVCAGISLETIEAESFLGRCDGDKKTSLTIPKGETFIITAVDSCNFTLSTGYKYVIRYKGDFYVVDTASVKTINTDVFKQFRLVRDKFKSMTYGVFAEHVLLNPGDLNKIDQVDKEFLIATIDIIKRQKSLLLLERVAK